ncbi:MAG TPA: S8 family serine peptidase [Pyrinomonadaceae bacterium]|jgi:subtilisin family serine protease|nr:S8 family serine peptidase [Pyrinomonadaceae bacterium]
MKKVLALFVVVVLCAMTVASIVVGQQGRTRLAGPSGGRFSDQSQAAAKSNRPDFAEGRYFVSFNNGVTASNRAMVKSHGAAVRYEFPDQRLIAIELHNPQQLAAIQKNPNVEYVEQEPMRYALGLSDLTTSELTPTATNGLYGLVTTRTTNVHSRGYSGTGFKVGIADTGLDYTHPDIAANYVAGYDTFEKDGNPWWNNDPLESHGTHVAGTVLGVRGNNYGIYGAAYSARLYHARVLKGDPASGTATGSSSGIMAGVKWLVSDTAGPQVNLVNMSLGGGAPSMSEQRFYNDCRNKYGAIIVAATGNDGFTNQISYPAAYTINVAVGAVDKNNVIASFSNRGTTAIDLVGPGVDVASSVPLGQGFDTSVTTSSTFTAFGMTFAGQTDGITRTLVNCGIGQVGEFPAAVAGNIALIQRGTLSFADKVKNAMDAGAVAAIVYNNVAGDFGGTLGTATTADGRAWIPAVTVSDTTGATLVGQAGSNATVMNKATNWDYYSGTSMATPHVTGITAVLWAANPTYTPAAIEDALKKSAIDLGTAGYDTTFGYGLVNADGAMARTGK